MESNDIIYGYHSCVEFIKKSPGNVNKIVIMKESYKRFDEIINFAKEHKIRFELQEKYFLDKLAQGGNHQGIIMFVSPYAYYEINELLESAPANPLFILLDGIEDPQNLGNIIRTCAAAGVDGILLENRRCAPVTSTVMKVSSGGLSSVKIARVNNLKNTFSFYNEKSIPIVATTSDGEYLWNEVNYRGGAALIFGSEGQGIRRILKEKSDYTIRIPIRNEMNSLNVSVAAGIVIYEVLRQQKRIRNQS